MKKAGFIFGAKYGRGFAVCRQERGSGWSAPAAMQVEGGSFGFQIGASETDVALLVMNDGGMKHLLSDKFTLGGDASIAAGPIGRSASAQTDVELNTEMLSYSRYRGLFRGYLAGRRDPGSKCKNEPGGHPARYHKPGGFDGRIKGSVARDEIWKGVPSRIGSPQPIVRNSESEGRGSCARAKSWCSSNPPQFQVGYDSVPPCTRALYGDTIAGRAYFVSGNPGSDPPLAWAKRRPIPLFLALLMPWNRQTTGGRALVDHDSADDSSAVLEQGPFPKRGMVDPVAAVQHTGRVVASAALCRRR